MSEIRPLAGDDFERFVEIVVNAYPGWQIQPDDQEKLAQRLRQTQERDPTAQCYGLFRQGELLGGMRLHDFRLNCLQHWIPAAGVGLVAVDLVHKKEHVAKEMMGFFLRHYRERGAPIVFLYPFRPDFYKRMGFGYSTKKSQYRVPPSALPRGPSKAHLRLLGPEDKPALVDCYNRYAAQTHGMMEMAAYQVERLMKNPQRRIVGYVKQGKVHGYMIFEFKAGENDLTNDLHVRELIYENREVLAELLTFLHIQFDQVRRVIITTEDETLHHIFGDPRNGSPTIIPHVYHESNIQGVGLMVRVIDVAHLFALLDERNYNGQSLRLRLTVEDSFLPENAGSLLLHFQEGHLQPAEENRFDVELHLEIAEFSSLVMGVVPLRRLYDYGLAHLSDPAYLDTVDRIFAVRDKPVCTTPF